MTENKRFTQKDEDDWEILDRNKHFAYAHSGYQAEKIIQELNELVETNRELYKENKELQGFKDKVFNLIDKTIESETQIAENIESTIEGDYVKAVNRLTIIAFENLKKELSK